MFKRLSSSIGLIGSWLALSGFTAQAKGFSPWWALVIVVVILLLLWWWLGRSKDEKEAPPAAAPVKAAPAKAAPVAAVAPDNLTKVEGIGPKVAGVLKAAGFQTFAQLADADVGKLEEILADNKLQMMKPGSWPKQAKLAADGKWDELQVLQDNLKGGK
jgi:predicted flap endonuclease-1-like 5' DNA nuclease